MEGIRVAGNCGALTRGSFRVIAAEDAAAWRDALSRFADADVYDDPSYQAATAAHCGGRAFAFVAEDDAGMLFHCFIRRPIQSVAGHAIAGGLSDLETAYGYGGPLATTLDPVFLAAAWEGFAQWCRQRRVVCEFLRFHPITYLDLGAHHPIAGNNTYLFYEKGYRGVLVEPNPALWEVLAATRPGDSLLRAGIGAGGQSEADYYVISGDGGLNTFSKDMAQSYAASTKGRYSIEKVLRLPLLDINEVMLKQWDGPPHILSIDTEGYELPILQSLDFGRLRPNVVCVDTLEFGTRRLRGEALELMAAKGYDLRGATFVNTIFVDRRHTR